jgi:hypothetical protein
MFVAKQWFDQQLFCLLCDGFVFVATRVHTLDGQGFSPFIQRSQMHFLEPRCKSCLEWPLLQALYDTQLDGYN